MRVNHAEMRPPHTLSDASPRRNRPSRSLLDCVTVLDITRYVTLDVMP